MFIRFLPILLLLAFIELRADNQYFDSLHTYIDQSDQQSQIEAIKSIPFDKMNSNAAQAIKLYLKMYEIGASEEDLKTMSLANEKLSLAYYYKGEYDNSVRTALAAIKNYEQLEDRSKVGAVYTSLGYQMKRRDLEKAFEYMQKGISFLNPETDKKALSGAYNNYGVLHEMNDDLDSALFFYKAGLNIVEAIEDSIGIPYSLNNIAGAYVILGKYDDALPYYAKALKIRKDRNDLNGLAENYTYFGDFYFKQEAYQSAIPYYLKAYDLCRRINYPYLSQVNAGQLAECYQQISDFKNALKFERYKQNFKDSLLNESTNKTINNLEIQFETEKKEKEIAEQKVEISAQEQKVQQKNYFLYGLGGLAFLIVVVSFFIYKQQKLKQQSLLEENKLKDKIAKVTVQNKLHEERLRISRDLHDNIGSQLTFIVSSVENMKYMFNNIDEKMEAKLDNVTNFTRTTITELRDTIWALNKDEIQIEDLKSRLYNYMENAKLATNNVQIEFVSNLNSTIGLNAIQGVTIYRIVQEAVNNAIKYSAASKIGLTIQENDQEIELIIADDGIGFNMAEISLGNGLENMKNRASSIEAQLKINSKKSHGTEIHLSLNKDKLNVV